MILLVASGAALSIFGALALGAGFFARRRSECWLIGLVSATGYYINDVGSWISLSNFWFTLFLIGLPSYLTHVALAYFAFRIRSAVKARSDALQRFPTMFAARLALIVVACGAATFWLHDSIGAAFKATDRR